MTSVHAVARHVRKGRRMSRRKLYYAQAWHFAWAGRPLFRARIVAGPNGPRIPES